jgi:hypothetical protein
VVAVVVGWLRVLRHLLRCCYGLPLLLLQGGRPEGVVL